MAGGAISKRTVGWYRANIEDYPELDIHEFGLPEQMVISTWHELSRLMHFHVNEDNTEQKQEENEFAMLVSFLTGDYYTKIECD